jgi:hypothetical protein
MQGARLTTASQLPDMVLAKRQRSEKMNKVAKAAFEASSRFEVNGTVRVEYLDTVYIWISLGFIALYRFA